MIFCIPVNQVTPAQTVPHQNRVLNSYTGKIQTDKLARLFQALLAKFGLDLVELGQLKHGLRAFLFLDLV